MPLELSTVTRDAEFEELVRVQYLALGSPFCGFRELFFPIDEDTDAARQAAVKECTERQMSESLPANGKWLKVTDKDTGKFLGAALWFIFDEDPYTGVPHEEVAEWYPEGEERDIATDLMKQVSSLRRIYMPKPHVFLDMMFTHPEARRQGVGKLLMDWGINEADKRNYETYLDATLIGEKMYESYGFVKGPSKQWQLDHFKETETRKRFEDKCFPMPWHPMYRPKGGRFEAGRDVLPWYKA